MSLRIFSLFSLFVSTFTMRGFGSFVKNKFSIISNITENITWDYDHVKIRLKEKVVRIIVPDIADPNQVAFVIMQ